MTPGKERLKPSHLLIRQPKKIAHNQGSSQSLNQITPSRSMGPDPNMAGNRLDRTVVAAFLEEQMEFLAIADVWQDD
jgi:hypothetical protein